MLKAFLITIILILVWFCPILLELIHLKLLYKKLNKEKRTNLSYKQFEGLVKDLANNFALNINDTYIVLAKVYSMSQQIVLKIGKNYYSVSNNSLIYLFNEKNVIEEKIKGSL